MANSWETLWDGEAKSGFGSGYNGDLHWLWEGTGENLLSDGDIVRITVDGVVSTLTVQNMANYTGIVEAGNAWLGAMTSHTNQPTDDGTDVYFWEYSGGLRFFTRTKYYDEMPHVKFERAIIVSTFTPDPVSMTMGWLVGRRIAGQRGK